MVMEIRPIPSAYNWEGSDFNEKKLKTNILPIFLRRRTLDMDPPILSAHPQLAELSSLLRNTPRPLIKKRKKETCHLNASICKYEISLGKHYNCIIWPLIKTLTLGLIIKERITFRKPFRNVILTLSWFYPLWTQSSFKSSFWNAFWNAKKEAFWIVIRVESLIWGHVNAKLFRNVIRACAFWKCALKPCMGI